MTDGVWAWVAIGASGQSYEEGLMLRRIGAGVAWGAAGATALSLVVAVGALASGGGSLERVDVTFAEVLLAYYLGWILAGAIVGAFWPVAKYALGAAALGAVAGAAVYGTAAWAIDPEVKLMSLPPYLLLGGVIGVGASLMARGIWLRMEAAIRAIPPRKSRRRIGVSRGAGRPGGPDEDPREVHD